MGWKELESGFWNALLHAPKKIKEKKNDNNKLYTQIVIKGKRKTKEKKLWLETEQLQKKSYG